MANLIVQRDRAFLMTDSGYFRKDGTLAMLFPKSMILEELKLALAITGSLHLGNLGEQIKARAFADVKVFLSSLGPMMRAAYVAANLDPEESWSRAVVAFYPPEHRRAYGCTLFTSSAAGPPGMAPWRIHPATKAIMPAVFEDEVFGPGVDLLDAASFNPAVHALPLIEAQRRQRIGWGDVSAACAVAGNIDLTTISRDGISVETLHSFPDAIGAIPNDSAAP